MAKDLSQPNQFSRRKLLRSAGLVVGATVVPRVRGLTSPEAEALAFRAARQAENLPQTLTDSEYRTLDAACSRLIPSDENGPGAREARAARYIDRALGGGLAVSRDQYGQGLAALDRHAVASKGAPFATLGASDQDELLMEVQSGDAPGFPPGFFNNLRNHTIQGTFSDPFYGGNAGFVGWDMIGYPGVRIAVEAPYQQMDTEHPPNHVSAYDSPMFEPGED